MVDTPTADNPREPDITHVNPAAEDTWFGHPRQLARLFTTEMWERFGYYGMRALLTLYLANYFLFSDRTTNGVYGGFTALVYLTPLVGGLLADRYLGSKRAVKFGAIIMSLGYLILSVGAGMGTEAKPFAMIEGQRYEVTIDKASGDKQQYVTIGADKLAIKGQEDGSVNLVAADGKVAKTLPKGGLESDGERSPFFTMVLLIGLSMVTMGNGFFKPNISTMVGELYPKGDGRRDTGFTIFYMGINLGSLFSQILCPFLATAVGWWAGFGLASIGMLFSWTLIQFDGGRLGGYGEPPANAPNRAIIIFICALASLPVIYFLFTNLMSAPAPVEGSGFVGYLVSLSLMGKLLFGTFLIGIPVILFWSWRVGNKVEFQMMLAAMILIVFNVVFWTLFEQAGSSLTLFADRNTDLSVFGLFSISAGQTQFFNAAFIVIFAPFMSLLWTSLARRGLEPPIPVKFAIALIGVGLGFLFLVWGSSFAGPDFKVGIWWLAGLYLIHSLAELCISPVGLSMITKLSIVRIVGLMMGVWFLSISVAQYVAGVVAQFASVETVGGQVTNLKVSLDTYTHTFTTIAWVAIGLGVLLFLLSFPLKKWMHGVK
ncbi:MAG: peptide MFS transporter [Sphingomonas sp.]|uniref:peptide MFS transporter n=1 Tax=Sphingomonas sp. TaxID=28214 RepID=UPI001AD2561C|nr:peptide MFS transporter [Sphingomonas sp.]MBN8816179.1 peptide MFS transporter [Sphingomonas sp.]